MELTSTLLAMTWPLRSQIRPAFPRYWFCSHVLAFCFFRKPGAFNHLQIPGTPPKANPDKTKNEYHSLYTQNAPVRFGGRIRSSWKIWIIRSLEKTFPWRNIIGIILSTFKNHDLFQLHASDGLTLCGSCMPNSSAFLRSSYGERSLSFSTSSLARKASLSRTSFWAILIKISSIRSFNTAPNEHKTQNWYGKQFKRKNNKPAPAGFLVESNFCWWSLFRPQFFYRP